MSCRKLKKQQCLESENCEWIVGVGCRPKQPVVEVREPSPKPSSSSSSASSSSPKPAPKPESSGQCKENTAKTKTTRGAPPYNAKDCKGKVKKGNDGAWYISVPDKNGVYRWVKHKEETHGPLDNSSSSTRSGPSIGIDRQMQAMKLKSSSSSGECKKIPALMGPNTVRKTPPYQAYKCQDKIKKGNDGEMYISVYTDNNRPGYIWKRHNVEENFSDKLAKEVIKACKQKIAQREREVRMAIQAGRQVSNLPKVKRLPKIWEYDFKYNYYDDFYGEDVHKDVLKRFKGMKGSVQVGDLFQPQGGGYRSTYVYIVKSVSENKIVHIPQVGHELGVIFPYYISIFIDSGFSLKAVLDAYEESDVSFVILPKELQDEKYIDISSDGNLEKVMGIDLQQLYGKYYEYFTPEEYDFLYDAGKYEKIFNY